MLSISKLLLVLSMVVSLVNPVCCCSGMEMGESKPAHSCCGGDDAGNSGKDDGPRFCDCHKDQLASIDHPEVPAPNEHMLFERGAYQLDPYAKMASTDFSATGNTFLPPPVSISRLYCVYLL